MRTGPRLFTPGNVKSKSPIFHQAFPNAPDKFKLRFFLGGEGGGGGGVGWCALCFPHLIMEVRCSGLLDSEERPEDHGFVCIEHVASRGTMIGVYLGIMSGSTPQDIQMPITATTPFPRATFHIVASPCSHYFHSIAITRPYHDDIELSENHPSAAFRGKPHICAYS